jgi:hypothetical protein
VYIGDLVDGDQMGAAVADQDGAGGSLVGEAGDQVDQGRASSLPAAGAAFCQMAWLVQITGLWLKKTSPARRPPPAAGLPASARHRRARRG